MISNTVSHLQNDVLILAKNQLYSILYDEINVIVCQKPYLEIVTDAECYVLKLRLCSICDDLPYFIAKIDKSTYVNLKKINNIAKENRCYEASLNGKKYPIARRRVSEIKTLYYKLKNLKHCADV